MRFYYAKLLDTPEEDHQVLGFVNPVLDSDDDDNIFEPERWCVKKDKNVFKLAFWFHAFWKFLRCSKLKHIKKFNFQCYRKTKMLQIIVFWSNRKIKMPQNCSKNPQNKNTTEISFR